MKETSGSRLKVISPTVVRSLSLLALLSFHAGTEAAGTNASPVVLKKVQLRENPYFGMASRINLGRNGCVFLPYFAGNLPVVGMKAFLMSVNLENGRKTGFEIPAWLMDGTANEKGEYGAAIGHFIASLRTYSPEFEQQGEAKDFKPTNPGGGGFNAPCKVEAGRQDFYALDQYAFRILRVDPSGHILKIHPMIAPGVPENWTLSSEFRVCEANGSFYWLSQKGNEIRRATFDGKTIWTIPTPAWMCGGIGGFDVDESGTLYVIAGGDTVSRYDADGKALTPLRLQRTDNDLLVDMRFWKGEIILKRKHPVELFQVYGADGKARLAPKAEGDQITVSYPSAIWTAGSDMPLVLRHEPSSGTSSVKFGCWLSPFNTPEFRELPFKDGKLAIPEDASGVYRFRVTPDTTGGQADLSVEALVEIRHAGTNGTLSVLTRDGRSYFSRGEDIPLCLYIKTAPAFAPPAQATVRLRSGSTIVAETKVPINMPPGSSVTSISKGLTASLPTGWYHIEASDTGLTGVPCSVFIGPGPSERPGITFSQYGDYGPTFPGSDIWTRPEVTADHIARSLKLGTKLFVDRLGPDVMGNSWFPSQPNQELPAFRKLLESDPLAPAEQIMDAPSPYLSILSAYGAHGFRLRSILLTMDAGLPIGTGFDTRTPERVVEDSAKLFKLFMPYQAFKGWSPAANWWVSKSGAAATVGPDEKNAWETARKRAGEDGTWDPLLDTVSDRWMGEFALAHKQIDEPLKKIAPGKTVSLTGPYRQPQVYPPFAYAMADEVDLHFQAEQIAPPQTYPHNVDFQKRPGKPAWGHPELWNDGGTGDYIIPTLFQMLMRGADGIGVGGIGTITAGTLGEDERDSSRGTPSIFRAFNAAFRPYSPWLASLENADQAAILCSARMFRLDDSWVNLSGLHFVRMFEAYSSCLYARHPVTFLFAEDLADGTPLPNVKAILLIDERVQPDPAMAKALARIKAAGITVFRDRLTRAAFFPDARELPVEFTHVEKDPSVWQDDHAYWRFPDYFKKNAPVIATTLGTVATPVLGTLAPDLLASERSNGEGRFVFVVNNTPLPLEPGILWRIWTGMTARFPLSRRILLAAKGKAVYDVFSGTRVEPDQDGCLDADFRTSLFRVYAILPEPIRTLALSLPTDIPAGGALPWEIKVLGVSGKPLATTIPVRIRLMDATGTAMDEVFLSVPASGEKGLQHLPLTGQPGRWTLEATELFGGGSVTLSVNVKPASLPASFDGSAPTLPAASVQHKAEVGAMSPAFTPMSAHFGPHARDLAVSANGKHALVNTMDWIANTYCLDLEKGKIISQKRLGHWFAFGPVATRNGFAVQGYDLLSPEGYHLYALDNQGEPEHKFPVYGLPKRLSAWMGPNLLERMNSAAVAPSGKWVATAGNLGLAVWSGSGRLLWSRDGWRTNVIQAARLLAPDDGTLIVAAGSMITAFKANSGKTLWHLKAAGNGNILDGVASADGRTLAFRTTTDSSRVIVLKDGNTIASFLTPCTALALAPDGQWLAVTSGRTLKRYSVATGLQWSFTGDDAIQRPVIAPDSARLAVGTAIGTLYELNGNGTIVNKQDFGALPVPAWLPEGDLLVATWMGTVCRLDARFKPKWTVRLPAANGVSESSFLARDTIPGATLPPWGNATTTPLPLHSNLLASTHALISIKWDQPSRDASLQNPVSLLIDGKPDIPEKPWLDWTTINYIQSGWSGQLEFNFDAFRTIMHVTGITFVEDPAHPESWLRDMVVEYWNAESNRWIKGPRLLSNSSVHSHVFDKPIDAVRLRLVTSGGGSWPSGNVRLGEIVLHGEILGCPHRDVVARRPRATLMDENEDDFSAFTCRPGFTVQHEDVFSGGRCARIAPDTLSIPFHWPFFCQSMKEWDFDIVETPKPGQYRYLQFAWKAPEGNATSLGVYIASMADSKSEAIQILAGPKFASVLPAKLVQTVRDAPPREWATVRVDLWELAVKAGIKAPFHINTMFFQTAGGPALFDQVVLGRTEADLPSLVK